MTAAGVRAGTFGVTGAVLPAFGGGAGAGVTVRVGTVVLPEVDGSCASFAGTFSAFGAGAVFGGRYPDASPGPFTDTMFVRVTVGGGAGLAGTRPGLFTATGCFGIGIPNWSTPDGCLAAAGTGIGRIAVGLNGGAIYPSPYFLLSPCDRAASADSTGLTFAGALTCAIFAGGITAGGGFVTGGGVCP